MKVVWTRPALRQLGEAREYIAIDNPEAPSRQIDLIEMNATHALKKEENSALYIEQTAQKIEKTIASLREEIGAPADSFKDKEHAAVGKIKGFFGKLKK